MWEHEGGFSPCLRKSGKVSQRREHLSCASKACETEKPVTEAQTQGIAFKKHGSMKDAVTVYVSNWLGCRT